MQLLQSRLIEQGARRPRTRTTYAPGTSDMPTLTASAMLHRLHSSSSQLYVNPLDAGKSMPGSDGHDKSPQIKFAEKQPFGQVVSTDADQHVDNFDLGGAATAASDDRDQRRATCSERSAMSLSTVAASAMSFSLALRTWTSRWQSAVLHKHVQRMLSAEQQVSLTCCELPLRANIDDPLGPVAQSVHV
jgi:hypothetical protein